MRLVYFVLSAALAATTMAARADTVSPVPSGSLADATLLATMSGSGASGATYTEYVYKDPNNEVCAGCLDFVLVIGGPDSKKFKEVDSITTGSFKNYTVDLAYEDDGDVAPSDASSTASKIKIDFGGPDFLYNGSTSDPVIFYTDALNFSSDGTISFKIGTATTDPAAFEPAAGVYVAPTPEPSSLALLGTGMLGFAGVLRRRLLRS